MEREDKYYSLLGLARKAGSLRLGFGEVTKSLKRGEGILLLLTKDAGVNSVKKANKLAQTYKVPILNWGLKKSLFSFFKRPVAVMLITDKNFAKPFFKKEREGLE